MFCPKCGKQLEDGAAFCGNCGAKLDIQPNVQAQPQTQIVTPVPQPAQAQPAQTQQVQSQPAQQPPRKKKKAWIPITAAIATVCVAGGGIGYYLYANSPSRLYKAAMSEANALLDEKQYKKAIKAYLDAQKYDKSSEETKESLFDAYLKYAKQLEKEEDLEGAAEQYEKALEINEDDKKTKKNLSKIYLAMAEQCYDDDKNEKASTYAKRAVELDKDNEDALDLLDVLGETARRESGKDATQESSSSWEESSSTEESSSSTSETYFSWESYSEPEEYSPYQVIRDSNGNVIDLRGMEIVVRDWWTMWPPAEDDSLKTEYEMAKEDYLDWIQETYNFRIHREMISDWGSTPSDFVEYASAPDDGKNYVWVLRWDPTVLSAMKQGLCYDLSQLDCLDFSEKKFQVNKTHELYQFGDAIYAMYGDYSEPRTGMFFNERLLREAGIDPDEIYDLQKSGNWTFDKFEELCKRVRQDYNRDGVYDVAAFSGNNSVLVEQAVYSNGGCFVGKNAGGKFTYMLEDAKTLKALNWVKLMMENYRMEEPDGVAWDYYKQAFLDGQYVFLPDQAYLITGDLMSGFYLGETVEPMADPVGFVMFPKGPDATDYVNCWENNFLCIPSNYDHEKAWKIAFAWNLYSDATMKLPGFEDYEAWKQEYARGAVSDRRAIDETLTMMTRKGMIAYQKRIPEIEMGPWLTWNVYPGCPSIAEIIEAHKNEFLAAIDEANFW